MSGVHWIISATNESLDSFLSESDYLYNDDFLQLHKTKLMNC